MKINNIQNTDRTEIVATNRKPSFLAKKINKPVVKVVAKPLLPQDVIDHFGLNMSTAVKYKGEPSYTPAPETVGEHLAKYFRSLGIDWETHVDPNKPKKRFE